MAIFRPQEAASHCEGLASFMTRLSRVTTGEASRLYKLQRRGYLRRRDSLFRKYDIEASPVASAKREDGK